MIDKSELPFFRDGPSAVYNGPWALARLKGETQDVARRIGEILDTMPGLDLGNDTVTEQQRHEAYFLQHCQQSLDQIADMVDAMSGEWVTYWST